jgi:hypothetical protein
MLPPGQQLRLWPMLQSSPQQYGTLPVVALLMQRLAVQQPNVPQHTCAHENRQRQRVWS